MFRLTATDAGDGNGTTLRVEGRLVGAWVDELAQAVAAAMNGCGRVTLDLSGVSFVDARGVECLRGVAKRGGRLVGRSAFVATLIPEEDRYDSR